LILTLLPLAISGALLLIRHWKEDDHSSWLRLVPVLLGRGFLVGNTVGDHRICRFVGHKSFS
jgi:hypothetical protein